MNLLDKILQKDNLNEAYKQVYTNKGLKGVDGITEATEKLILVAS